MIVMGCVARPRYPGVEEVQEYATRWLWTYNHERPNIAVGDITPKQNLALAASFLFSGRFENGGTLNLKLRHGSSNTRNQFMKRIITSILIGVILYFLLPLITKFIPHYRLAVWSVTAALVSLAVSTVVDKA